MIIDEVAEMTTDHWESLRRKAPAQVSRKDFEAMVVDEYARHIVAAFNTVWRYREREAEVRIWCRAIGTAVWAQTELLRARKRAERRKAREGAR